MVEGSWSMKASGRYDLDRAVQVPYDRRDPNQGLSQNENGLWMIVMGFLTDGQPTWWHLILSSFRISLYLGLEEKAAPTPREVMSDDQRM